MDKGLNRNDLLSTNVTLSAFVSSSTGMELDVVSTGAVGVPGMGLS